MVKISSAACVLLAAGSANAYSTTSRSTLRSLGSKSIPVQTSRRTDANLKMEGESLQNTPFSIGRVHFDFLAFFLTKIHVEERRVKICTGIY